MHGVPKTMFAWRNVIPLLTPKYRVCAVDLRGFGDSERPPFGYDCGTMASDLIRVADAAGFDKFRVVGEDWGAAFAWTLAATQRERVVGLVYQGKCSFTADRTFLTARTEMILPGLGFEEVGSHLRYKAGLTKGKWFRASRQRAEQTTKRSRCGTHERSGISSSSASPTSLKCFSQAKSENSGRSGCEAKCAIRLRSHRKISMSMLDGLRRQED